MKPDEEGHDYSPLKEHGLSYIMEKDTFLAGAVVSPGSIKLVNEYLTPLLPVSKGRSFGMLFYCLGLI
ncbi:hypothetical protein LTR84_010386 [Exophiala bonariae]|uniref:Uncharacterized protein n=1 Tax=Exophiala bonariae TaxID=1690606 RepID=A0AAV9MTA5_9EURO|nr:hypothetical protein LTR84_010386 [Exophiala bonariae]